MNRFASYSRFWMPANRNHEIKAAPEKIFPLINDFHQWTTWSPYGKLDPGLENLKAVAEK